MSEKRFRSECVGNISLYFIVDNSTAKRKGKNTSYKAYETGKKEKTGELVNLLNSFVKENEQLQEENKYLKKRIEVISDELYCKDRKLEELGVPIECCDKK